MKQLLPLLLAIVQSANAATVIVHGMLSTPDNWREFGAALQNYTDEPVYYYDYQHLRALDQIAAAATGGKDFLAAKQELLAKKMRLEQAPAQRRQGGPLITGVVRPDSLAQIKGELKAVQEVLDEEAALLTYLNTVARQSGGMPNIIAHSLGASLVLNALKHQRDLGVCVPYINVIVFLGSNMSEKNMLRVYNDVRSRFGRVYSVYSPEDRGAAWAFGRTIGRNAIRVDGLTAEAKKQIRSINAGITAHVPAAHPNPAVNAARTLDYLLVGTHGRYRNVPNLVANLLEKPLICSKEDERT